MRSWLVVAVALVSCLGFLNPARVAWAEESKHDETPTPEAQQLAQKVKAAYTQLQSLQTSGKVAADLDVGGRKSAQSADVSATYKAPGLFHHEVKGEVIAGSTGEKYYILETSRNVYMTADAPKGKVAYRQLPRPFGELLEVQDPTLLLALSAGSIDDVLDGARRVKTIDNTVINGDALPTLMFTASDGRIVSLAFDPKTSLLRQARYDISELLRQRGAEKVNKAIISITYDQVTPDAKMDAAQFAWAPPAAARELKGGQADEEAALELQGKPAPDFTASGVDGKPVTLSSLKGNVVVLDFWATWCGPCVMSLPGLDQLYQAKKGSNVKIFAVNAAEEKEEVTSFLSQKKLTLPVLLDPDSAVQEKYSIGAYPTTVVIGPDGIVSKVFVGVPRGGEAEIAQAVDDAAKNRQAAAVK